MTHTPLVEAFIASATAHFCFLVEVYALIVVVDDNGFEWVATMRYSGHGLVVHVEYADDRNHFFCVTVGRPTPGGPDPVMYGLSEWLDALGIRERRITEAGSLWEPDQVERSVRDAAAVLSDFLPKILSAGEDVAAILVARREAYMRVRSLLTEQQRTR